MKIVHCCLANYFVDGYGYQENILTRIHKEMGLEVTIVASTETIVENKGVGYVKPAAYISEHGIPVIRLPYARAIPHFINTKLRIYEGLYSTLLLEKPDILFLHDCNFLGVVAVTRYMKENPETRLYIDSHTDYVNSGRTWVSMNILHKIIYRYCAQVVLPYTDMFYGTLPQRMDFYRDVYKIPENKIALLEMGADDKYIDFANKDVIRRRVREKYGIEENTFTLVTGGKIEPGKNIFALIEAFKELREEIAHMRKIHLIIFGTPDDEVREQFESSIVGSGFTVAGWIKPEEVYDLYFASDLAVFPGTHSVLWEQAVGCGLPCVFKKWKGIGHVDLGGNCILLENCERSPLKLCLANVTTDTDAYDKLKKNSEFLGPEHFSYRAIAKRAIDFSTPKDSP